nr:MAG TPA: hypothetical protein [Caudoviricetes sp.]
MGKNQYFWEVINGLLFMVKKSVIYIHLGRFKREIRKRSFRFPLLNLHAAKIFLRLAFAAKCSGR